MPQRGGIAVIEVSYYSHFQVLLEAAKEFILKGKRSKESLMKVFEAVLGMG